MKIFIKQTVLAIAMTAVLSGNAHASGFTAGRIAVLQIGDGGTNQNISASDIWASRQNPYFVDEFLPNVANQTTPTYQVAIPTNGPTSLWCNGNAGTEGNMTLAEDRSVLTFSGYCGDICSIFPSGGLPAAPTAPSNISYDRGIGTVDAFGTYANVYRGPSWYGIAQGKTNPRGDATDGKGHFWGCGNGFGSLYYDANTQSGPNQIQSIVLTSCSKIINGTLYNSVKTGETGGLATGIYSFVDFNFSPLPLPMQFSFPHLEIPTVANNNNCLGFDINPQGNIAYVTDKSNGIFKYIKNGQAWQLAYNLEIPGYDKWNDGIRTNAASTEVLVGAFSVTVDWTGAYPVVYATTGDMNTSSDPRDPKAGGLLYYANRVIRIDDTNTLSDGSAFVATTNILTTVVQAPVYNPSFITNGSLPHLYIVYKSVALTPDLTPIITNNPVSWSAAANDNVQFSVGVDSHYTLYYQWLTNGIAMPGQNSAVLVLNSVQTIQDGTTFQCVITNSYGAVTSSIATLAVSPLGVAPTLGAIANVTDYIGNTIKITANVGGTDAKGGYQWYFNGNQLSDANEYSGTTSSKLTIVNAQTVDAGVYSLFVTNLYGSTSNAVENLTLNYPSPQVLSPPQPMTTFVGRVATNFAAASPVTSQTWWTGQAVVTNTYTTTATVTNIYVNSVLSTPTTNNATGKIASATVRYFLTGNLGQSGQTLILANPQLADATPAKAVNLPTNQVVATPLFKGVTNGIYITNTITTITTNIYPSVTSNEYFVVFSNPNSSATSGPVALTVYANPASHTFVSYSGIGNVYSQNFDTLPTPGGGSSEAANPQNVAYVMTNFIAMATNISFTATNASTPGITYGIDNPVDFGFPIIPAGTIGGFGLSNSLAGWYAWCQSGTLQFALTTGDQSAAGIIDHGENYNNINGFTTTTTNRSVGLLTSSKSGYIAFGMAIVNTTGKTLNKINLGFTGELWRNNPNQQILNVGYLIDPAGTSSTFPSDSVLNQNLSAVTNFAFPTTTVDVGTLILDGTLSANQTNVLVAGLTLGSDWLPGQTLWLVWQASTAQGGAQDVAIDNVSFSATPTPVAVTQPALGNVAYTRSGVGAGAQFGFSNSPGASWQFTVWGATNIALPFSQWSNLGHPTEVSAGNYQFTDAQATNKPARFYKVTSP